MDNIVYTKLILIFDADQPPASMILLDFLGLLIKQILEIQFILRSQWRTHNEF